MRAWAELTKQIRQIPAPSMPTCTSAWTAPRWS
jgi:hypothetical protein